MIDSLQYGTTQIEYSFEFFQRKTLGIIVHPDTSVEVKAPLDSTLEQIKNGVHRKAAWILKQQRFFKQFDFRMPEKKYVSGESHLYLGRQYKAYFYQGSENKVMYHSDILDVVYKSSAQKVLQNWFKEKAKLKFSLYAKPLIERFSVYGVAPTDIEIRKMNYRWGSCTPNNKIILNTKLIHASKGCIEYVILHELCHLVYKNHTKDFYDLLMKEMPSWYKWKMKLEKQMM